MVACDCSGLGSVTQNPLPALCFSAPVGRSLVSQWFCEILPLARQWLKRAQKRDFAPVRSIENIYWRPALWVHACVFVHVCGCQHLHGLWMKESVCSELGTPARQHWAWQAQQSICSLVPAPQKKESGFLTTERFMMCGWNFYLNPENRAGLILNSQERAAAEGGAGRHQLSNGSSFPLFPPQSLLLSDLQLPLLLPPAFGEQQWTKEFRGLWHPQAKHVLLQAGLLLCCSIAHRLSGYVVAVSCRELVARFTPSLIAPKPARMWLAQYRHSANCNGKMRGCEW